METRLNLKWETLTFKPDSEPHIVIQKEWCISLDRIQKRT